MDDPSAASSAVQPADEAVLDRLFGDGVPQAQAYTHLLVTAGLERGLLGPREAPRIWDRHVLNSAVLAEVIAPSATLCDVGSGAGLPGIPLAIARPDLTVTLLEPLLRRSTFLQETVEALGLANVTVIRGRAEERTDAGPWDVVTARAVAPLDRLARWAAPLLGETGELLALKGSTAAEELASCEPALRSLGAVSWSVSALGQGVLSEPTYVTRVEFVREQATTRKSKSPQVRQKRGSS